MAIVDSQLLGETDKSVSIKLTAGNKDYTLTVAKLDGYTSDQLVTNWTKRATREFMTNRAMFQRMFVDRINRRHEKIISGEIQPVTGE